MSELKDYVGVIDQAIKELLDSLEERRIRKQFIKEECEIQMSCLVYSLMSKLMKIKKTNDGKEVVTYRGIRVQLTDDKIIYRPKFRERIAITTISQRYQYLCPTVVVYVNLDELRMMKGILSY